MNILYFYQYFTTPAGAWSTRVYEFASRWVRAGDSVTVVTSVYDKSDLRPTRLLSRTTVEGIDVRIINVRLSNKHGIGRRLFSFGLYAGIACWYALTLRADVVVCSSGPITVALPGLAAHFLRRRQFVFEVRDLWPEGSIQLGILRNRFAVWIARAFERICYRSATLVICLSDGMAQWIRERYGAEQLEVIPNPANIDAAEQERSLTLPEWARGKRLVVYAGTLGLIDDCAQILDAARELQDGGVEDIEIVLLGDGRERPLLEERAKSLDLRHVHFLGLMPKDIVWAWLQRSDCALFVCKNVPFLSTASPNKLFDALAAGVPVVQTTDGWIATLFEREECGLSVKAGDPRELATAVCRIVFNSELHARLSANAARVARSCFRSEMLAAKMRSRIAEAVEG